jgi:thymidylate kinase
MDRCGKDTQIENVTKYLLEQNENKSVHVLHYASLPIKENIEERSSILYYDMFRICDAVLKTPDIHLLLNRAHLGEMVYGYIYRKYDARWIYQIEKQFQDLIKNAYLITLVDSSFKCISNRDDGLSLSNSDINKAKTELERFVLATELSGIKHKILIDIANKDSETVFNDISLFISR